MDAVIETEYLSCHANLAAVLENLQEFVGTLPAPDENGEVPESVDWGTVSSLKLIEKTLGEAMQHADSMDQ